MGTEIVLWDQAMVRHEPERVRFDSAAVAEIFLRQFSYLNDFGGGRAMKGAYAALQRAAMDLSLLLPMGQRDEFMLACGIRPASAFDLHVVKQRVQRERLSRHQSEMLLEFSRRDEDEHDAYTSPTFPLLPLVRRSFEWSISTLEALENRALIEAHPDSGNRRYWRVTTMWRITDEGRKKAAREKHMSEARRLAREARKEAMADAAGRE